MEPLDIDQIGEQIRAELSRVGADSGAGDAVTAWPAAVGDEIARNAWPARTQPDGTLVVHVRDAIWGFELTQRATEISERLPGRPRLRFTPGPLPGDDSRAAAGRDRPRLPGAGARGRRDHGRDCGSRPARICRKSHKSGARAGAERPPRLIHFLVPANAEFAGLFS